MTFINHCSKIINEGKKKPFYAFSKYFKFSLKIPTWRRNSKIKIKFIIIQRILKNKNKHRKKKKQETHIGRDSHEELWRTDWRLNQMRQVNGERNTIRSSSCFRSQRGQANYDTSSGQSSVMPKYIFLNNSICGLEF